MTGISVFENYMLKNHSGLVTLNKESFNIFFWIVHEIIDSIPTSSGWLQQ